MKYKYIAIEGVIGAGKTTLAHFIANHYSTKLLLEEFEDNPFLAKFYQEKDKYNFALELSFLASRYHQVKNQIEKRDLFQEIIVSDFVLYKSLVFASINLEGDELDLYKKLFQIMFQQIPVPDLTIFIYHTTESLRKNIMLRGREYEMGIEESYLEQLNENYLSYFKQLSQHRIVIIDGKDYDIVHQPQNSKKLIQLVNTEFPLGITYL
ncbi:MAG: deoxynucleoside kinase [Chitinophagales bacterium]|nr:deoxynucleoside kinase [Sphingobacteriales bacterium]